MNTKEKTPASSGGKKGQVFTEKDFLVGTMQADVSYGPLRSIEVKPEAMRHHRNSNTFGTAVAVINTAPGLAESFSFDKPLRLEDHPAYHQWLAEEDEYSVRAFWLVHSGHELNVWSRTFNRLNSGRAAYQQEQQRESGSFHLPPPSPLELLALERIEFHFRQLVDAAGEVHSEHFLDELYGLIDGEEGKKNLRHRLRDLHRLLGVKSH